MYCGCGCGGPFGMRHAFTKEEKMKMLKEYKGELEQETKAVSERIKELEKAK